MKKLGMQVEPIEDVQSIVIKTPKGNWVFGPSEVTEMTMQGVTTYQITGKPTFEPAAHRDPRRRYRDGRRAGAGAGREGKGSACRDKRRYRRSDRETLLAMIEAGDRVLLVGEGREFFVRAGPGTLSTDKGQLDLGPLVGAAAGRRVYHAHRGKSLCSASPGPRTFSCTASAPAPRCSPKTSVS